MFEVIHFVSKLPASWKQLLPRLDPVVSYGLLVFTSLTAGLSALVTYDFKDAAKRHPDLSWLYGAADHYVPVLFTACFVISVVLSLLNVLIRQKTAVVARDLAIEREKIGLVSENLRVLFNGLLAGAVAKLAVGDARSRMSLYVHDGDGDFTLCGRYSYNPQLRRVGRPSYPDHEGCIGRAWREGWHYRVMPHQREAYDRLCLGEYQLSQEALDQISMRSKTFAAKRIDGRNGEVAVVVYESLVREAVSEAEAQGVLDDFVSSYGDLIESFRNYVPTPDIAAERGF